MDKMEDKQQRQPISEGDDGKTMSKHNRPNIHQNMTLDCSLYEEYYKGQGVKLAWIADLNGEVHKWLQAGAEPVPRMKDPQKTFKGINDKFESDWVYVIGGQDDSGNVYRQYLLKMDEKLYDAFKNEPVRKRNEDIQRALKSGQNQSDTSPRLPGGGGIATYAPELGVTDGQGYNSIKPGH